jgi:hypothetical protein
MNHRESIHRRVDSLQGRFIAWSIYCRVDSSQSRFIVVWFIAGSLISTENLNETWNFLDGHTKLGSFCCKNFFVATRHHWKASFAKIYWIEKVFTKKRTQFCMSRPKISRFNQVFSWHNSAMNQPCHKLILRWIVLDPFGKFHSKSNWHLTHTYFYRVWRSIYELFSAISIFFLIQKV